MKALGNKSLSSVFAKAINVFWWLEWIALIVVVAMVIIAAIVKKAYAVTVPVTFSEVTLRRVQPLNNDFPLGILNTTSGNLYLQLNASWQSVAMLLMGFALLFAVVIMVTYQLKTIFSNFKQDIPFNEANISRIRNIAFVLMAYSGVQWLFIVVENQVLTSNLKWEHIHLTYSFNFSWLITGVILLVVAEIFKQGTLLDNEQKLTI
ncbi:DUF2975 domain-containing protein [Mucilaginibacter sp.]|uniref:DUF2975 domain-containing protein n=1 Tax=Mucilaginibacter sp. TaxID=1882438 RepID=UPI0025CC4E4A|nr:DUF2975 domain-containing protein [Mucilaginibacter sp.]